MGRITRQFTKLLLSLLSHAGMKWWVATVLPRALRFKRPLHHCNACNPIATRRRIPPLRDTAARPVKVLADTGISRRVKWSERRVTLPLALAPEASASLLGYALMVEHLGIAPSIPAWKTGVYLSTPMLGENGVP